MSFRVRFQRGHTIVHDSYSTECTQLTRLDGYGSEQYQPTFSTRAIQA
jgi:hypothetical protein